MAFDPTEFKAELDRLGEANGIRYYDLREDPDGQLSVSAEKFRCGLLVVFFVIDSADLSESAKNVHTFTVNALLERERNNA